jgi:tetratricopeptide (TPR) repeat protein
MNTITALTKTTLLRRPGARIPAALIAAAILTALASCASEPKEIPSDLEPIEYFQKAQQAASDDNNYDLALRYYRTFIERHPEDFQRIIEARYEIAFIHYKQGKLDQAEREFNQLLENYEGERANVLPAWPRILAQKVLEKIEETRNQPRGLFGRRRAPAADEPESEEQAETGTSPDTGTDQS